MAVDHSLLTVSDIGRLLAKVSSHVVMRCVVSGYFGDVCDGYFGDVCDGYFGDVCEGYFSDVCDGYLESI